MNLGDLHLYYFEKGKPPRAYPIGIAKDGYATPTRRHPGEGEAGEADLDPGSFGAADDPSCPKAIPPGPTTRSASTRSTSAGRRT